MFLRNHVMDKPVQLFSQVSGEGSRQVILLHGLFGMSDNLGQLAKALNDGYRIHRLDLRNHGHSSRSDRMTLAHMAGDIGQYIQQNKINRTAIIGHSLGGKVAMQLALEQPKELLGIVVADIAPVQYQSHHDDVLKGLNSLNLYSKTSRSQVDEALSKYVQEPNVRQFLLKNLYRNEQRKFDLRINLPVITQCYPQVLQAPQGETSQLPTLFIKGGDSDYIRTEHTETIKTLFPQLHFKMISGTGHWLHAEKPDIFNRLVRRFLDDEIDWAKGRC